MITSESASSRLVPNPALVRDDLERLTAVDYERALEMYVEGIATRGGVRLIGRFGSVNTPGVSDLDLLVIVEDDCYVAVKSHSSAVVDSIPHGPYILWHPAAIIPESLVAESAALHSFEAIEPLWGEASLLAHLRKRTGRPSPVHRTVWNSYFWRLAMGLTAGPQDLRTLLLIMSNVVQSVAGDYQLIGEPELAEEVREWGLCARQSVMVSPSDARPAKTCRYLAEALHRWEAADRLVQTWWTCYMNPRPRPCTDPVPVGGGASVRFSSALRRAPARRPWHQRAGDALMRLGRPEPLELPGFYLDVTLLLREALSPRLATFTGPAFAASPILAEATQEYAQAVHAVRSFSRRAGEDEFAMFGDPFITPFAL